MSLRFFNHACIKIFNDEFHHLLSSISDSLHGHGRESIWEHGTDEESADLNWLKDIDGFLFNSSDESTKKSKTNEASRSNSETFTNGSSGITSGVKGISLISNGGWKSTHLSNSSGIIGDWSVTSNSKGNWEVSEQTKGSNTNTIESSFVERVSNGGSKAENWDNARDVSECKSLNDIWSSSHFA